MAAVVSQVREESGEEVGADVIVFPGGLQEEEDSTRQTKGARAEGASTSSAACVACRRVFTLMKTGLARTHGPVDSRCPGSRAPPASSSVASQPMTNAPPARPVLPNRGEAEVPQRLDLPPRHSTKLLKRIPRGSREGAAKKLASLVEAVVTKNDQTSWNRLLLSLLAASVPPRKEVAVGILSGTSMNK